MEFVDDFEYGYHSDELGELVEFTDELMEEIHNDPISEEACKKFCDAVKNMRTAAAEVPIQSEDSGMPFVADKDTGPTMSPDPSMNDEPEYRPEEIPTFDEIDEMGTTSPPYMESGTPETAAPETPLRGTNGRDMGPFDAIRESAARRTMGAPTQWEEDVESQFSWLKDPDKLHYYTLNPDGNGMTETRHDAPADGTWLLLPGDEMPLDQAIKEMDGEIQGDYNDVADTVASALSRFGAFSSEVARAGGGKGAASAVNFAGQIAPMIVGGVCSEDMRRILMEECERSVPPVKGRLLDKEERERLETERHTQVRQRYADAMRLMAQSANMIYYGDDGSDARNAGNVIYQDIMRRSAKKTFERTLRGRDPEAMKQAAKLMAELSKRSGGEMHGNLMRLTSPDNMLGCCMIFNTMNPVMLTLYLGPILIPALLGALFWMREKNRLGSAGRITSDYRRLAVDITMAELSGSMGQVLAGLVKNGCDPREALTKLLANTPKMETTFSEMCKLREEMLSRYPVGKTLSEEDKSRWNELLTRYGQVKRQFYQQLGYEVDRSRGMAIVESALSVRTDGINACIQQEQDGKKVMKALEQARAAALAVGATEAELAQPYVPGQSRFSSQEAETYVRMQYRYDMLQAEIGGTCDALSRYAGIYSRGELPPMHTPEPPTNAFRHAISDIACLSVKGGENGKRAGVFLKNIMPLALPMFLSQKHGNGLKKLLANESKNSDPKRYRAAIDIGMLQLMKIELAALDKKQKDSPNGTLARDDEFRKALLETQLGVMLTDKTILEELSDAISYGDKDLGKWAVDTLNKRIIVVRGFTKNEDGRLVPADVKVPIPVPNYTDKDRIDGLAELSKTIDRWERTRSEEERTEAPWETMLGPKETEDSPALLDAEKKFNRHDVFAGLSRIEASYIFGDLAHAAQAMPDADVQYYEDMRTWKEENAGPENDTPQRAASILPLGMGRYDKDIGENRYDRQEMPEETEMDSPEVDDDDEYRGR